MSSGGPPHHPHNNRPVPPSNAAWNLQVPSYFPRQPQLAHMQTDLSRLHQPTWHTPTTTDTVKILPHTHILNEMLKNEAVFPRDCVDLSLTRNGNQNGEFPTTPISLSVRDTNKINSLPASVLDMQTVELTKCANPCIQTATSPGLRMSSVSPEPKSASPGLKSSSLGSKSLSPGRKSLSPTPTSASPGRTLGSSVFATVTMSSSEAAKIQKRGYVRVDSILERLNPITEKAMHHQESKSEHVSTNMASEKPITERSLNQSQSVIQATSSFDENSNSSSIVNVPSTTHPKEDNSISMHSNEDSLDSTKTRRKRKPNKTVRVNKEDEAKVEKDKLSSEVTSTDQNHIKNQLIKIPGIIDQTVPVTITTILEGLKIPERRRSSDELDSIIPAKTRRKTSSESETIDNIAAMVQEGLKEKLQSGMVTGSHIEERMECHSVVNPTKLGTLSVIKTKANLEETLSSTSDVKTYSTSTVKNTPTQPFVTLAQKKASNTHFVEVENKLEEMFAGIVEDHGDSLASSSTEPLKSDTALGLTDDSLLKLDESVTSTSQELTTSQEALSSQKLTTSEEVKKNEYGVLVKKPQRNRTGCKRVGSMDGRESPKKKRFTKTKGATAATKKYSRSPIALSSNTSKITKKTTTPLTLASSKTPTKTSTTDLVKDVYAYDSGSNASSSRSRGPFVQIKGPRDSPLSVSIVNAPLMGDEDGERRPAKTKKFHDDSEYRHKVLSKGLHCSTLSTKYDAQTKDTSWICSFCKRGPHASELSGPSILSKMPPPGDLFGPYFISTHCLEFEKRLEDPYDRQFKSKKIGKILDEAISAASKTVKKLKRKHSESSMDQSHVYLGITDTGSNTYEVWAHEDCLVWAPGIYLVGPKIVGLEEAVWTCCNISCSVCNLKGANIACLKRGCLSTAHLSCARATQWQFDKINFKAYCPLHTRQCCDFA